MKKFYYDRQKLGKLLLLNAVLLCIMMFYNNFCPCYIWISGFVSGFVLLSFTLSLFIALFPPRVALIDEEGIIIDHNVKLKWSDIKKAQKLKVRACLLKREIIRLEPKKGKGKPWTLMQYISHSSAFGAFSVPLYAMSEKDAKSIEKLLQKHIKIEK